MIAETWHRIWCPSCGIDSYFCTGNEQDLSRCDIDAVECRQCKKIIKLFEGDEEIKNIAKGVLLIEVRE